jgi:ribosomal protein S18 acetylase RimI-like enzyme
LCHNLDEGSRVNPTGPTYALALLTAPQEVDPVAPEIIDVYRAAFGAPGYDESEEDVAHFGHEQLPQHVRREGFRLVLARAADGQAVGFAYGYTGRPGQWWCDRMREKVPAEIADAWLGGHFEVVELGVRPEAQRRGIGAALHDALLADLPHDRALLTTWRDDRPARRLYLRKGWRPLADIVEDDASLLGVRLPTLPR